MIKRGDIITAKYLNSLGKFGGTCNPTATGFLAARMGTETGIPRFQVRTAPNTAYVYIDIYEYGVFEQKTFAFGSKIGTNASRFTLALVRATDLSQTSWFWHEWKHAILPYKETDYTTATENEINGTNYEYGDETSYPAMSVANFEKVNGVWNMTKLFMDGRLF